MDTMIILSSAALGYALAIGITSLRACAVKSELENVLTDRPEEKMSPYEIRRYTTVISAYNTCIEELKAFIDKEKETDVKISLGRTLKELENRKRYLLSDDFLEGLIKFPSLSMKFHMQLIECAKGEMEMVSEKRREGEINER